MTKEEFLAKAEKGEVILIDIREAAELAMLPSPAPARHIPMSEMVEAEAKGDLPKDKIIVTICHSGGRCLPVNGYLVSRGYQVDHIEGGMMGWEGRMMANI
jgi:rhodanese-related sulfurtransferase